MEDAEYEDLKEKYKTLKEQTEYILKNYPSSRELDELLWWLVLKTFYPDLAKLFGEGASELPRPDGRSFSRSILTLRQDFIWEFGGFTAPPSHASR